jgi:hypothetical protein
LNAARASADSPVAEAAWLCWTAGCVTAGVGAFFEFPQADRALLANSASSRAGAVGGYAMGVAPRENRSLAGDICRDRFFSLRVAFAISFASIGEQAVSLLFHFAQDTGNRRK